MNPSFLDPEEWYDDHEESPYDCDLTLAEYLGGDDEGEE